MNSMFMINLFQLYYNNGAQCVKLIQENQYFFKNRYLQFKDTKN